MSVELFQVGGSVRDELLDVESHDIDFTALADSWESLLEWLDERGFKRFVTKDEYLTVRAHFPKGFMFAGQDLSRLTADIVMSRADGAYSDGRRPDMVIPGDLRSDIMRRDFTVNALAKDADGQIIDLVGGRADLESMTLRAVGDPNDRIREDALRALRGLRFCITKGFRMDKELTDVIFAPWLPELIAKVALDRRREELMKCFKHDTLYTMRVLSGGSDADRALTEAIFSGGLWLEPTNKGI